MPIGQIISQAWRLSWKHKFLWIFGILAGGSSFPTSFGSFDVPGYDGEVLPEGTEEIPTDAMQAMLAIPNAWATHDVNIHFEASPWLIVGGVALLLALIYLCVTFGAGLVWSVDQLHHKKHVTFWDGWRTGRTVFWRFLLLGLYIAVLGLGVALLVGLPIFLLLSAEQTVPAFVLGIVGVVLVIPWLAVLSVVGELASRLLILDGKSIQASVREGFALMKKKTGNVVLLWLVHIGLTIAVGITILIACIIWGLILLLIGGVLFGFQGFEQIPAPALLTYGIVAGILLFVPLLISGGWTGSFLSAFWTLGYRELVPTKKA